MIKPAISPTKQALLSTFRRPALRPGIAVSLLLASALTALNVTALGEEPGLAPGTATGILEMGVFPAGEINGESVRFAPGARIHDQDKRLVLPASIANQRQRIAYTRDAQGLVNRVWLITAEQARALAATRNREGQRP